MDFKDFINSGVNHPNKLARIYFISAFVWLFIMILADIIFIIFSQQYIKYNAMTVGELLYALLVITFVGLIPLLPLWFVDIKKIGTKKEEGGSD